MQDMNNNELFIECEFCGGEVESPPTALGDETMEPMAVCNECRRDAAVVDSE